MTLLKPGGRTPSPKASGWLQAAHALLKGDGVSLLTPEKPPFGVDLSRFLWALSVVRYLLPTAHTFSSFLTVLAFFSRPVLIGLLVCKYLIPGRLYLPVPSLFTSGKPKGVRCPAGHPVAQRQREGGSGLFVPKPWVNYSFDSGA